MDGGFVNVAGAAFGRATDSDLLTDHLIVADMTFFNSMTFVGSIRAGTNMNELKKMVTALPPSLS